MEGVVKMDNNYLVDIQHERLSFFTPAGEVKALNDVSIHLKEGEVLGIVGESGSGKSVTAYSLMGLTAYPGKLIGGELHFNGHEVEKMTEKDFSKMRGKEVSIIFQDPLTSLNPVYTIGNQIMEVIRLHTDADKKKAYARAVELLSLVGFNEPEKRMKQYPHEFSGGMRQRVMIAMGLICHPQLLIADEPTTALDVTIQEQILHLIKELNEKLDGLRVSYAEGNKARKEQLKPTILQAEEQLNALLEQPGELEKKARNAEINYLKNKR